MLATPELIREAVLQERLAELVPRWLEEVPLYRRAGHTPAAAKHLPARTQLAHLPFITKQDIRRDFPHNFLRAGADLDGLLEQDLIELEHTSGTSEERTSLLLPRGWWAEQEQRALLLNPFIARVLEEHPAARRVTINSPVCSNDICYTGVPPRSERIVGNALFLSLSRFPFLWSETDLARMAAEAIEWQPQFLDIDPVYGVVFALYCERHGIVLPSLRFILCSYEFVSVVHRRILARVFGVPVFDLYGSTETGHLLMEDDQGQLRPSLETAFLEITSADEAATEEPAGYATEPGCARPRAQQHSNNNEAWKLWPRSETRGLLRPRTGAPRCSPSHGSGNIGELVVTTLTNDFMPLLLYRIGDLVARREQPYGTRYELHGRVADSFMTAAGRVTTREIDQCFVDVAGIAHYQISEAIGAPWRLRFVPDGVGPDAVKLAVLERRLVNLLHLRSGLMIQPTDMLLPEGSGKFRLGYPARCEA